MCASFFSPPLHPDHPSTLHRLLLLLHPPPHTTAVGYYSLSSMGCVSSSRLSVKSQGSASIQHLLYSTQHLSNSVRYGSEVLFRGFVSFDRCRAASSTATLFLSVFDLVFRHAPPKRSIQCVGVMSVSALVVSRGSRDPTKAEDTQTMVKKGGRAEANARILCIPVCPTVTSSYGVSPDLHSLRLSLISVLRLSRVCRW